MWHHDFVRVVMDKRWRFEVVLVAFFFALGVAQLLYNWLT